MTAFIFFFNDTATTEIYTLSLHDALPIYGSMISRPKGKPATEVEDKAEKRLRPSPASDSALTLPKIANSVRPAKVGDRKSTRLNSSHVEISYAVFCLKKKNKSKNIAIT